MKGKMSWEHCILPLHAHTCYMCMCLYTLSFQMGIPFWYALIRKKKPLTRNRSHQFTALNTLQFLFFSLYIYVFIFCLLSFFEYFPPSPHFLHLFFDFLTKTHCMWAVLCFFPMQESSHLANWMDVFVCGCLRLLIRQLISLLLKWIVDLACLQFFCSFRCMHPTHHKTQLTCLLFRFISVSFGAQRSIHFIRFCYLSQSYNKYISKRKRILFSLCVCVPTHML